MNRLLYLCLSPHSTWFPSPTGVNHYESKINLNDQSVELSFRPQQGLTIMNNIENERNNIKDSWFPSPTGVNHYE